MRKLVTVPKFNKKLRWTLLVMFKGTLLPKTAFHQILLGYWKSPCHQWVMHVVICRLCPSLHGSQMFRDTYISWVPAVPHFFHVVSPWRRREGWRAGDHLGSFQSLHYRIFSLLSHPLCSCAQRSPWIQRKLKSIRVSTDKYLKKELLVTFFPFYCLIIPFLHTCSSCFAKIASTSSG